MEHARIEDALVALKRGEMVVVVDDEDRENEGDLIVAAELATPEHLAFFVRHTSGYVCAAMPEERAAALGLGRMVADNTESQRTAFLVSVDARQGTTTGISAVDRATTVRALSDLRTRPVDLARPGHVMPLAARPGGVLERAGHTEAAVDLCRLAGLAPVGVLCEVVDQSKLDMARGPELARFAAHHGLLLISISDLARYRRRTEKLVRSVAAARIPTRWGDFTGHVYESVLDGGQHLAMVLGDVAGAHDVVVRVHQECVIGDILGSNACACSAQLDSALAEVAAAGCGVVVYLRGTEGRGLDLGSHPVGVEGGVVTDDQRRWDRPDPSAPGSAAQVIADLGIASLRAAEVTAGTPDPVTDLAWLAESVTAAAL